MQNLNNCQIMGNATRDPEFRNLPNGTAVCDLSLAINRSFKGQDGSKQEETTFVDVTLWSRLAEICRDYVKKGNPVFIAGRLQQETWTDKNGEKRSKLKVVAENLQLLTGKPEGAARPAASSTTVKTGGGRVQAPQAKRSPAAVVMEETEDEVVPF